MMLRQKRKAKVPPRKTIDKYSLAEYTEYRKIDTYTIERNSRVTDENFRSRSQEEVYTRIYLPMKNRVVKQHHINVDHMRKNTEYFGEALAMCEKFGLLPLMEFTQNWDEELVQFYTTVFFTENEQKTIKWLTNGQLLEATWSKFGEALGYPILDTSIDADANGWRCHDSEFADKKET
jgi:hypothetical protein